MPPVGILAQSVTEQYSWDRGNFHPVYLAFNSPYLLLLKNHLDPNKTN